VVVSYDTTLTPNFVEVGELLENLKWGNTYTDIHGENISINEETHGDARKWGTGSTW
jgi:hypothetical protein